MQGSMYAPDYLRAQKDEQLHPIADLIEHQIDKIKELERSCDQWQKLAKDNRKEIGELEQRLADIEGQRNSAILVYEEKINRFLEAGKEREQRLAEWEGKEKVLFRRIDDLNEKLFAEAKRNDEQRQRLAEAEKVNQKLLKDGKDELATKDKRIAHLESECTRLYDPTKKFWNEDLEKRLAEAEISRSVAQESNTTFINQIRDLQQRLAEATTALESAIDLADIPECCQDDEWTDKRDSAKVTLNELKGRK